MKFIKLYDEVKLTILGPDGGDLLIDEYCNSFLDRHVWVIHEREKDEANGVSQIYEKEKPPIEVNQ